MSADDELPMFIRRHFNSVWALEIMLFLQARGDRGWRVDELVREMRASQALVLANLQAFERAGLVSRDGDETFRFATANPLLSELCQRVADAYRDRPVAVINLIAGPEDRLQQLAAAFRFSPPR
jgi:hypothetical protein